MIGAQPVEKLRHPSLLTLNLDGHSLIGIGNIPPEIVGTGEPIDKGAKPNPLHYATDDDFEPLFHRRSQERRGY